VRHETDLFTRFSHRASKLFGSSRAFVAAILVIVIWLVTGPMFHYSNTWQLIINTGTTVVTFLMVFVIQSSQNRDAVAFHLKLDELIRATKGARNSMIDLASLSDKQLDALEKEYLRICEVGDDAQPHHRRRASR
jgi:low affinity Fe/Cu permease